MRYRFVVLCLFLWVGPVCAQSARSVEPWQPQILVAGNEPDPRLFRPVHARILGRATVPALATLSESTGVLLRVDPERLATTGERKVTVIADGCDLKSIMVQLCEALQDSYWVVDRGAEQPVYTLTAVHEAANEAAVYQMKAIGAQMEQVRTAGLEPRRERLEAARRALQMSPEELEQLEQSDLLLARAMRYPPMRANIEFIFSLPPEKLDQLASAGHASIPLGDAPQRLVDRAVPRKDAIPGRERRAHRVAARRALGGE
jgi:hypothetical protein